jgi:hypothetical protein
VGQFAFLTSPELIEFAGWKGGLPPPKCKYAGQVQLVNLMLSSSGKDFPRHEDAMYGVLYSTKITH